MSLRLLVSATAFGREEGAGGVGELRCGRVSGAHDETSHSSSTRGLPFRGRDVQVAADSPGQIIVYLAVAWNAGFLVVVWIDDERMAAAFTGKVATMLPKVAQEIPPFHGSGLHFDTNGLATNFESILLRRQFPIKL